MGSLQRKKQSAVTDASNPMAKQKLNWEYIYITGTTRSSGEEKAFENNNQGRVVHLDCSPLFPSAFAADLIVGQFLSSVPSWLLSPVPSHSR